MVLRVPTVALAALFSAIVVALSAMSVGVSFTGVTVRTKVCAALVSTPLLAVPPSSTATTDTVAVPLASAAEVKVSVPLASSAGWALKSALLVLVTVKLTDCEDSFAGPDEMVVATLGMLCAPASSKTSTVKAGAGPSEV